MLFLKTMMFDPFDQIFSQRWPKLKLSKKRSGPGCVNKWWYRMGENGWEVVSLSSLKGWLSPGDKQIRFDSPRPSLLKPHSPSPVPKKGTFPEKKRTVLFLSPHNEFFFCRLSVVVAFVFDIACILLIWRSSRAKLFQKIPRFLRNSRKIPSR